MEKLLRRMAALLLACVLVCAHAGALPVAAAGNYGLTLDNGVVKLDGKPYYAMGVNLYDAFLVQLRANEKDTRELDAEFKQLHDSGIPLARISMCGYSAKEFSEYIDYPEFYFSCLDKTVALAEKYQIGIVFDLCWAIDAIPGYCYGYCSDIGDPSGEVLRVAKAYVKDVVTRYKGSPAVWAWEIGNEYNLSCDLKGLTDQAESLWVSVEDVGVFYRELAKVIRSVDPYRLITGGDSEPRISAWHQWKQGSWATDSFDEMAAVMKVLSPAPMDMMSVHVYQEQQSSSSPIEMSVVADFDGRVGRYVQAAKSAGQALFVGEFGIMEGLCADRSVAKEILSRQYKAFMKHGVQLSCIWVYGKGTIEDDPMTISPTNALAYQYNMVVNGNKAYRSAGKQDAAAYWRSAKPLVYREGAAATTAAAGMKPTAAPNGTTAAASTAPAEDTTAAPENTTAAATDPLPPVTTAPLPTDGRPADEEKTGRSPLIWILPAAGALALGGGAAAAVLIGKKKERKR